MRIRQRTITRRSQPRTAEDFHLLVRLKVFNSERMNETVFTLRRYENASLCYTKIESHGGLTNYGPFDAVVAKEVLPDQNGNQVIDFY